MKKYNELGYEEREEINELFTNWLGTYTDEVIKKVIEKADEIINNDMSMMMLRELYKREQEEQKQLAWSVEKLLSDYEAFKIYDVHNHCGTHAGSYRDVLYDMYIK